MIHEVTPLAVTSAIATAGFLGNLYIVLCLVLPRNRDRMESVTQTINMTIGVASFWHTLNCILTIIWAFFVTETEYLTVTIYKGLFYTFSSILFSKVGITTLLFILYWTRIVPLKSPVLLKVKEHLPQAVPLLMICCVLTSFTMNTTMFQMDVSYKNNSNVPSIISIDVTTIIVMSVTVSLLMMLPFCFMVFVCLSMLLHLNRHMKRLQSEACDIASPQTDTEKKAMGMLICQLFLYAFYILILFSILILEMRGWISDFRHWDSVIPSLYSLCTAINMIQRNRYLRKRLELFLSELKRHGLN